MCTAAAADTAAYYFCCCLCATMSAPEEVFPCTHRFVSTLYLCSLSVVFNTTQLYSMQRLNRCDVLPLPAFAQQPTVQASFHTSPYFIIVVTRSNPVLWHSIAHVTAHRPGTVYRTIAFPSQNTLSLKYTPPSHMRPATQQASIDYVAACQGACAHIGTPVPDFSFTPASFSACISACQAPKRECCLQATALSSQTSSQIIFLRPTATQHYQVCTFRHFCSLSTFSGSR